MAKNVVGIDISDFSIEAVALEKHRGGFKIEAYSRFRLSPEIVEDARILNKEKFKEAILKMFDNAKPHSLDTSRKVFLSAPESKIFSRVLSLPKSIKDKALIEAARNKAEEIIPEFTEKLVPVAKLLPDTDNHRHVFYAAAEIDILQDMVDAFKEINIEVAGITAEAISSFAGIKKDKNIKNILLLDLGARTTIASIFADECLCSSINIDIGGHVITRAIMEKGNISYTQAEEKKMQVGLSSDGDGQTMMIVQGQLQPLLDELKVFMKYWQESKGRTIEQVILIGGLSQMKGIGDYFAENLNRQIQIGQPFLDDPTFSQSLNSVKYINALGLARLSHQGTDFDFYEKLKKKEDKKEKKEERIKNSSNKERKSFTLLKNKYFWIILVILILGGLGFFFRDYIVSTYNSLFNSSQEKAEQVLEVDTRPKIIEIEDPSFEERVFVGLENTDNIDNFLVGEYYQVSIDQDFEPARDPDYTRAVEVIGLRASDRILELLESDFKREEAYTIPEVISYEVTDLSIAEEDYVIGQPLEGTVVFQFLSVSDQAVKEYLAQKYPEKTVESLEYSLFDSFVEIPRFELMIFVNKQ